MSEHLPPQHQEAIKRLRSESTSVVEVSTGAEEVPNPVVDELDEPDLDSALDELEAVLATARAEAQGTAVRQRSPEEQLRDDILSTFHSRSDRPTDEQIAKWKETYGEQAIQLLALDEANVYVYTHITVKQWEKIQSIMQQAAGTALQAQAEKTLREKIIRTAVLWPKLDASFFEDCRAGLPNTLHDLILIHSYFLTPGQAMTLTTQL